MGGSVGGCVGDSVGGSVGGSEVASVGGSVEGSVGSEVGSAVVCCVCSVWLEDAGNVSVEELLLTGSVVGSSCFSSRQPVDSKLHTKNNDDRINQIRFLIRIPQFSALFEQFDVISFSPEEINGIC